MPAAPREEEERAVAAVLETFDKCREWPDFIHSLQQLNGILASGSGAMPSKFTVAKRLAQGCAAGCSASVHTKVLELYGTIFRRVGAEQLARDLPLYSIGVLPLLAHAGPQVLPAVLELLEVHYLALGERLRPCLPGLVTALTAVLHEADGTEPRVLALLADIAAPEPLCSMVWGSLLRAPHSRLGGLRFLAQTATALPLPEPAAEALCGCLADPHRAVQEAAAELAHRRFPLERFPHKGVVSGMVLLLRHEHREMRGTVLAWLQPATNHAGHGTDARIPCATAAAAVQAALQSLLDEPRATTEAAWPFQAIAVLAAESRLELLPSVAPPLLRRMGRQNDPASTAASQLLVSRLTPTAVWSALADIWDDRPIAGASDKIELLETALKLAEGERLPLAEATTQHSHLPRLLSSLSGLLCAEDAENGVRRLLAVGLRLAGALCLDGLAPRTCASQLADAAARCERFLLRFARTTVRIDASRLIYRVPVEQFAGSTSDEAWVPELFATACRLISLLHDKQTPETGEQRPAEGSAGDSENAGSLGASSEPLIAPPYRWARECASARELARVASALAVEAALPPFGLALMHALDAMDADVAWCALVIVVDICTPESGAAPSNRSGVSMMMDDDILGAAIAQRAWDFLPSSLHLGNKMDSFGACVEYCTMEGESATGLWWRLHDAFPQVCTETLTCALSGEGLAAANTDLRLAHFRRFGLLCVQCRGYPAAITTGALTMVAASADPCSLIRASASTWVQWAVSSALPLLLHALLPAIFTAVHTNDEARAVFLWQQLAAVVKCDGFVSAAVAHDAPGEVVSAARVIDLVLPDSLSCLQLVGESALAAARVATAADSRHVAVAVAAIDCLGAVVIDGLRAPRQVQWLAEPLLVLLAASTDHPSATALQMPLLSAAHGLINAHHGDALSSTGDGDDAHEAPRVAALEACILKGLRKSLSTTLPPQQWLSFALDAVASVQRARPKILRETIGALVGLISASGGALCSGSSRKWMFVRGLAVLVENHLAGLVDLEAETLPAEAFIDTDSTADTGSVTNRDSATEGPDGGGLWGLRALVSSTFLATEAEETVQPPPPAVQAGVVVLQALPVIVGACVSAWGGVGLPSVGSPGLSAERAEAKKILACVWRARPFALFGAVLQWWMAENQADEASECREALVQLLHADSTAVPASEILTVACKVLELLYNVTKAREEGATVVPAVELKWCRLPQMGVAKVEPAWASLVGAFIEAPVAEGEVSGQLTSGWPAFRQLCHDALHTALVPCHAPIPPALLLLRIVHGFLATAAPPADPVERTALQDLTTRLVGQCLSAIPRSNDAQGTAVKAGVHASSETWQAVVAAVRSLRLETAPEQAPLAAAAAAAVEAAGPAAEAAAADAVGLLTLRWLGSTLPTLCRSVWSMDGDDDKLVSTLEGFVPPVVAQLDAKVPPPFAEAAATLISAFAENAPTLQVWRPAVLLALQRGSLFGCTPATLEALRPAVAAIFKTEPGRLTALLARGQASGSALGRASSAFKRSTDALAERAAGLRRLTFVLWCGAVEQHCSALPTIVEALVQALQAAEQEEHRAGGIDGASSLRASVFLCMRAVAVRTEQRNLAPFWPLAIAEMLRVLATDSRYAGAAPVVAAARKLLSILRVLRPAEFASFADMLGAPGRREHEDEDGGDFLADAAAAQRQRAARLRGEGGAGALAEAERCLLGDIAAQE